MKPVYLEFCGINSFSEKTEIDFRTLLAGGVFGIFGDTGSGKSTLLDCIHLALYGKIERSDSSECINYKLDSAYVIFDFELTTDGVRRTYRVKRERKRKNNGAKAFLYEYNGEGKLLALAEGPREVNAKIEEIVGLTFADFKTCIALPQGDFAALVKALPSERVKLVSRLFDLEKYGERLFKTVSGKTARAEEAVNLLKAKMGENQEGTEENLTLKKAEIAETEDLLKKAEEVLKTADAAYTEANELKKEKTAYEELKKSLERLSLRLPDMQKKQAEAERCPYAKAVCKEADGVEKNRREKEDAKRAFAAAETAYTQESAKLERAKEEYTAGNYDEAIVKTSIDLEKVRGQEGEIKAKEEAEKLYKEAVNEYKRLNRLFEKEDFDGEIASLQEKITALGEDESLLDYIKRNCKDLLVGESYGEFRKDLYALQEKHPETEEDIGALLAKYTPKKTDPRMLDIAQMNAAFKQTEERRKLLKKELDGLEKRKLDYETNETKKTALAEKGKIYREMLNAAQAKTAQIEGLGDLQELENKLKTLQNAKSAAQEKIEKTQSRLTSLLAEKEKQNGLYEKCVLAEAALLKGLEKSLEENGFACVEEARSLIVRLGDGNAVKGECKEFFDGFYALQKRYEETDERKFAGFDEAALQSAKEERAAAQAARDTLHGKLAALKTELSRLVALRERYKEFEKELGQKEGELKTCEELKNLLKGNRFLEFIASEYLQEVCVGASKTLLSLTGGRYFLKYDKDFKVGDNLDGGNLRSVKTLSGGETFLVSLSLALSLSAAICIRSLRPIEFFFLDEGFGTLDDKLVDTVMDVLGKLGKQNLTVGLISHVEELKHRIDNKILVTGANESHGSRVRMERF